MKVLSLIICLGVLGCAKDRDADRIVYQYNMNKIRQCLVQYQGYILTPGIRAQIENCVR